MCLAAIYWARFKKVYYANSRKDAAKIAFDDDLIYREIVLPITQRKIPMKQILRKEALEVFKAWQEKADKIRY
jgi:tRNA(Arg) A34 adenosine deaminase TadA